jgi:plasmid replication initiation protein
MRTIELKNMEKDVQSSLIRLSNSIANTRYTFSLPTQKLLFYLVSKITYEEKNQQNFLSAIEIPLEEMYNLLKASGRENSKDLKGLLKTCVNELGNNNIRWSQIDKRGKEYWVNFPWFTKSEIIENTGKFTFRFNNELAKYLLPAQNYFKSNVEEYLQISSTHAINLYLLFRANAFQKKIQEYYIEELKNHLAVEEKYPRWDNFKKFVLDPSILQLNKETNYFFTYEAKRIGRSIGKIQIRIIEKSAKEEFSKYFSEKMITFLKKSKDSSVVYFTNLNYVYDSKKNHLYIEIETNLFAQSKVIIDEVISANKDIQSFIKSHFRKGLKVYYTTPLEKK